MVRILCSWLLLLSTGLAGQDLTAPLLTGSWQSTFHNPAMLHLLPGTVTIGTPGITNDLFAENVTYDDLFLDRADGRTLDLTELPDLLDERNTLRNTFSFGSVGLGVRLNRWTVGAYHRIRSYAELDYPRTLVEAIGRGNASFVGQTIEIAPRLAAGSYHELGFSAGYAVSEWVFVAGRVKYLGGISDLRTNRGASLQLTTGEENYALTLDQDLTLNTTGVIEYRALNDIDLNYDLNRLTTEGLFGANRGLSFDLGVVVAIDDLRLQLAATDLGGGIDWSTGASNLVFSGSATFSGLDVLQGQLADSISFAGIVDSLNATFGPQREDRPYRSELDQSYYLGADYDLTERWTAGAMVVLRNRLLGRSTDLTVSLRYALLDWLRIGTNYAYVSGTSNVGLHLFATPGPVQLFLATDNLTSLLNQRGSSRSSVRLGGALVFGGEPDR